MNMSNRWGRGRELRRKKWKATNVISLGICILQKHLQIPDSSEEQWALLSIHDEST